MRHRLSRRRLRHKPNHSRSIQRNLVTAVLLYESVRTTKKRAEVVQPLIDKLITTAKNKPASIAIRAINQLVTHKNASRKMMEVLRDRYKTRSSGFTRLVPLGSRHGDGAKLVNLMLVDGEGASEASTEKKLKSAKPKKESSPSNASA